MDALRRRLRRRDRTGRRAPGPCPRPPACSSAAAPRRGWRPASCAASWRHPRLRAGAEVTVECNPEDASAERLAAYRRAGVTRALLRGPVHRAPRAGRASAAATTPATVAPAPLGGLGGRLRLVQRGPHLRGGRARSDDDWERLAAHDVLALAHPPPHVSAYALTVEPGTPLAAEPAPPPRRRRRRPGATSGPTSCSSGAGYRWEEISNWALPGHGCRAQPPLLGPGRLPGHRLGGPLAPRRDAAGGTCGPRSATWPPSRPAARRWPATSGLTGEQRAVRGPGAGPAHPPGRARRPPWRPHAELDGLVERARRAGGAHPAGAGSWPTRVTARLEVGGRTPGNLRP